VIFRRKKTISARVKEERIEIYVFNRVIRYDPFFPRNVSEIAQCFRFTFRSFTFPVATESGFRDRILQFFLLIKARWSEPTPERSEPINLRRSYRRAQYREMDYIRLKICSTSSGRIPRLCITLAFIWARQRDSARAGGSEAKSEERRARSGRKREVSRAEANERKDVS